MKLSVTETSSSGSTATLEWTLYYIASYAASTSGSNSYTVTIDGEEINGSYRISGLTGTNKVDSGTVTISKGSSSKTISFSISVAWNLTWSGSYCGTKTASGSITVDGKSSYTVSYSANGGSGAPSSQTKTHGATLKLSTTKPTRSGYTFQGWGTSSSSTSVSYDPGDSYSADASITLYAVWKANTYTVSYNANGGTGAPSSQTKTHGVTLKLSSTKPTRTNYAFLGWGTSASSTTVTYSAGGNYTTNASVTLYAVWEQTYIKPRIDNYKAIRCTSEGVDDAKGTYALVSFDWATDRAVTGVTIRWRLSTSTTWLSSATVSASGTSGSISKVVGAGELATESVYIIQVEVRDGTGDDYASTENTSLAGTVFAIDFKAGGTGVALGKAAELDNTIELGLKTRAYGNVCFVENEYGGGMIGGVTPDGEEIYNIQPVSENGNCTIGYGNYERNEGNTNIYGNGINFYAKENFNVNAKNINLYTEEGGAIYARNEMHAIAPFYIGAHKAEAYVEKSGSNHTGYIQYASGLTIQWGTKTAACVANTSTATSVQFQVPYKYIPFVVVNPYSTSVGTKVLGVNAYNISNSGFDIRITRTNDTSTDVDWLAVGFSEVT